MNAKSASCEKDGLKKGPWTPEEDQKLIDYIKKQGHGRWRTLPKNAGLKRCGKSCRLRWTNYLRPDIKRGKFSLEEEEAIIQLHSVLGNKWSTIASRLPGRTDNEIKNYWNTHIRKRLMKMGIDPVTHAPRLDLLELSSLLNSRLNDSSSSSQLNHVPNYLLGNMPVMNENLLNLATSLLSYQPKTSTATTSCSSGFATLGDVQETLVFDTQNAPQSHFPSLEESHFQTCLTPSTSVSYEANESSHMMRTKLEQLSQTLMEGFSINSPRTNSLANAWQNNTVHDQTLMRSTLSDQSFVATNMASGNHGYRDSTQSSPMVHSSSENQGFVSWNAPHSVGNGSLSSLLSTPSSSPYVNYSTSTSTTHDDERDSFCKNMFVYDLDNFAFNGNEFV